MKFTYDPTLYQLDDGRVLAQFVDVAPFDKRQLREDKFPNSGPLVQWSFKIMTGPDTGKTAFILTPAAPTPKNACMRMLTGITGHPPGENEEIDIGPFKGRYYAILINDGRPSHQFPPQAYGPSWKNAKVMWDSQSDTQSTPLDDDIDPGF